MALLRWKVSDLVEVAEKCVLNKFDFVCFIEGNRGLGKSTLGYIIACKLRKNKVLTFKPKQHMVYSRADTLKLLASKKRHIILSDEMINVAYNRSFYEEDQKKLLKALNMYRDSCNVFIGCIPKFSDLDNQIRRLCKIRITVIRRGVALIHKQVRGIYSQDPWDTDTNVKQERKAPRHYGKLTTCIGIMRFGDLKPKARALYEKLKQEKRGEVFQDVTREKSKDDEMLDKIYDRVIKNNIDKKYLIDSSELLGKKYTWLIAKLNQRLKDNGKETMGVWLKEAEKRKETDENKNINKHTIPKKLIFKY